MKIAHVLHTDFIESEEPLTRSWRQNQSGAATFEKQAALRCKGEEASLDFPLISSQTQFVFSWSFKNNSS